MVRTRTAVTLIELIIVVLILAAMTFIALPRLNMGALYGKEAHTIAKKIVTDLRRTRTLAISNAAANPTGYRLRMVGSAPYASYQIVNDANGALVDSQTIDSPISCTGGSQFAFGPLGNLKTGSDTQATISSSGKTYTVTIIPATGIVECTP
jgi:Tfp pilus assembly protein FimT